MNLLIGHYHLRRGGVTRIVQSQVRALCGSPLFDRLRIVSGTIPDGTFAKDVDTAVLPELGYLDGNLDETDYHDLRDTIRRNLDKLLAAGDLIHFHNPNLGKNPVVTFVLHQLAGEGYPLLLHCHDFAEDRPENMELLNRVIGKELGGALHQVMYPLSRTCRYGALTTGDLRRLVAEGVPAEKVDLLPNPVSIPGLAGIDPDRARAEVCTRLGLSPGKTIFLYPIRVIPRKNIGELILLMKLFEERAVGLVTLAPQNPLWRKSYENWRSFAEELGSPVIFEVSERVPFETLMLGADRMITTSTREGFGMSYLEPWLIGKPVVGRRIDLVVQDFADAGIRLDTLYPELPVDHGDRIVDFGTLDEERQREVIRGIVSEPRLSAAFLARTGVEERIFGSIPESLIEKNRETIKKEFSLERYRDRLSGVYAKMAR